MGPNSSRYALISVTNKDGVSGFARSLHNLGFKILSTGGTADALRSDGLPVVEVSDLTGFEECLDGRVKTLHPKVHGSILYKRDDEGHVQDAKAQAFVSIDVVCINLYDFASVAGQKNIPWDSVIEKIDVGGPAMIRAAAKNHCHVYVVTDPADYDLVTKDLSTKVETADASLTLRRNLAKKAFALTASYDQMIAREFSERLSEATDIFSSHLARPLTLTQSLRYGENAHQKAALYTVAEKPQEILGGTLLQGKELSYNNLLDLDSAARMVADFSPIPAVVIVKHTNPCGAAVGDVPTMQKDLFLRALASDPKCAFGGIVALNQVVDLETALAMAEIFFECVIAPDFTPEAREVFARKKNLRLLKSKAVCGNLGQSFDIRSVFGGLLIQESDLSPITASTWTCVSERTPTPAQLQDMQMAMTLVRHVKSNAILVTKDQQIIGVGAGQMSRVDSARIAIAKAKELGHSPCEAVAASDAFFPFRDSVDVLAKAGVSAIVQPGGSVRDQESIDAAQEHGIVMMVTHQRHFRH